MVALAYEFERSSVGCKILYCYSFYLKESLHFLSNTKDKLVNGASGNYKYECVSYESMGQWWHQLGQVMKHITLPTNDAYLSRSIVLNRRPTPKPNIILT